MAMRKPEQSFSSGSLMNSDRGQKSTRPAEPLSAGPGISSWIWPASLAGFILAGATGALYRFGLLYGLPEGLALANVRHAHSHLMLLGWVTPATMGLIAFWWPRVSGRSWQRPRLLQAIIALNFALGLAVYVPFILYGYGLAPVGGRELPLSGMILGLSMFGWYGLIALYAWETRGAPRPLPVRLWDGAFALLFLASIGAWGVSAAGRLALANPFWSIAGMQLFLTAFTEGWLLLGVLGLLAAAYPACRRNGAIRTGSFVLLAGTPLLFLLQLPADFVPVVARLVAGAAGLLVFTGLLIFLQALWPVVPFLVRWLLLFLGLKAAAGLLLLWPAGAAWTAAVGLRISMLHWLLLGFVSLGLVWIAGFSWPERMPTRPAAFWWAVTLLILTLLPLTGLWPAGWRGRWALEAAAWGTIPPLLAAAVFAWRALRPGRNQAARKQTAYADADTLVH